MLHFIISKIPVIFLFLLLLLSHRILRNILISRIQNNLNHIRMSVNAASPLIKRPSLEILIWRIHPVTYRVFLMLSNTAKRPPSSIPFSTPPIM